MKYLIIIVSFSLLTINSFGQMTGGGGGGQGPTETSSSTYDGPKSFWMPLGVGLNMPKAYLKGKFGTGVALIDDFAFYLKGVSSDKVGFGIALNLFDVSTLSDNTGGGGASLFVNAKLGFVLGFKISDELTIDSKVLLGGGFFSPSGGLVTKLGFDYVEGLNFSMRNQIGIDGRYALSDKIALIAGLNFNSGRQNFYLSSNYSGPSQGFAVSFRDKINTRQLFGGIAFTW